MLLKKKRKLNLFIIAALIFCAIFSFSLNNIHLLDNSITIQPSSTEDDIIEFWKSEIDRVYNLSLNIRFGKPNSFSYTNPYTKKKYIFNKTVILFDSPNWVGASQPNITLRGYLFHPEDVKENNPGCLLMHDINARASSVFHLASPYLEKGFIVLCYSHPGHGESEGAEPDPDNLFFEGEFNEISHIYLTICGAIQALRVLRENLTEVDNSKIIVTGHSYGAMCAMYLSGICGDLFAGALPYGMVGDYEKSTEDPTKLMFWVMGKKRDSFYSLPYKDVFSKIDPIHYLKSDKVPPILWQVGTNDEFFTINSINGTFNNVQKEEVFLQIHPNGHHSLTNLENTTKFFIDYIINNGPSPIKFTVSDNSKQFSLIGDILEIETDVDSDLDLKSVEVCYKYLNIIGSTWNTFNLVKSNDGKWNGTLNPGIVNSRVEYYIIATLEGSDNIWFCSEIHTSGIHVSNFTVLFYILFFSIICAPAIFLMWRRYNNDVRRLEEKFQSVARKNLFIEFSLIGIMEVFFVIAMFLPLVVFKTSEVIWTNIYFFNNICTWGQYFGNLAPYTTAIFIITFILYFHLSILKPMLSTVFKLFFPMLLGLMLSQAFANNNNPYHLANNFGQVYLGETFYIMLVTAISPLILGIWKRTYQTELGIRDPKANFYNIDRWLGIKMNLIKVGNQSEIEENKKISNY